MYLNPSLKSILAAVALSFGLAACDGQGGESASQPQQAAGGDTLATIRANDKIRIGVFGDKPPFGYVDANGQNQGFDVEIPEIRQSRFDSR